MKKIVITGGPCSGKTSVIFALRRELSVRAVFVPEAATLLLEGGFPLPGRDLPWSRLWQNSFQYAIVALQQSLEDASELQAQNEGKGLLVCDRGLLDGAAYLEGAVGEFVRRFNLSERQALLRYDRVIHLQSLAAGRPELYGKGGNEARFEPVAEALRLEQATFQVWAGHPHRVFVAAGNTIAEKISIVSGIVSAIA